MSKALDEYLGIPHSDRESCAMDADDACKDSSKPNAAARDRRDSSGFLTVGTKVRFDRGGTGKIIKVKKIYRYGYVEPEYTVEDEKGNVFIENEGRFTAIDSAARDADELNNDADLRNADAAEACDATATVKSLNAIDDAMSAIKSAMDKVRSAYAVYCGEIGREKPNANVKDSNSRTFKALEEAKSAAVGWYRSLYSSQRVF